MWHSNFSDFTKGFYIDMFNNFGIVVNNDCLLAIEKLYKHCYPVGFSNVFFHEDFISLDFIVRVSSFLCKTHKFILHSNDYSDLEI